jgi:hypothetical protein
VVEELRLSSITGAGQFSISNRGTLVYAEGGAGRGEDDILSWIDREGNIDPLPFDSRDYRNPRLSPDGNFLAYDATRQGRGHVWVYTVS